MKEILEKFAIVNSYITDYGTTAFQNLRNSGHKGIHLFIDPIKVQDTIDPTFGMTTAKNYSGSFMMVIPSNLSEHYAHRYDTYIEPCKLAYETFKEVLRCSEYVINNIGYIEIVNSRSLDLNCDGLLITYSITHEQ